MAFLSGLLPEISMGLASLFVHKLRSMLTMLGMIFGVGAVVAMLSITAGAQKEMMGHTERPPGSRHHPDDSAGLGAAPLGHVARVDPKMAGQQTVGALSCDANRGKRSRRGRAQRIACSRAIRSSVLG